mmetsp:Transcript_44113/g.138604  ORF Transcript_44113/g.138604 Transcript_44113/m.138604 type:complete len:212 (+) Transcript_44113:2399-3034(+)
MRASALVSSTSEITLSRVLFSASSQACACDTVDLGRCASTASSTCRLPMDAGESTSSSRGTASMVSTNHTCTVGSSGFSRPSPSGSTTRKAACSSGAAGEPPLMPRKAAAFGFEPPAWVVPSDKRASVTWANSLRMARLPQLAAPAKTTVAPPVVPRLDAFSRMLCQDIVAGSAATAGPNFCARESRASAAAHRRPKRPEGRAQPHWRSHC